MSELIPLVDIISGQELKSISEISYLCPQDGLEIKMGSIREYPDTCIFTLDESFTLRVSQFYPPSMKEIYKPSTFVSEFTNKIQPKLIKFMGLRRSLDRTNTDWHRMIYNPILKSEFGSEITNLQVVIRRDNENPVYYFEFSGIKKVLSIKTNAIHRTGTIFYNGDFITKVNVSDHTKKEPYNVTYEELIKQK